MATGATKPREQQPAIAGTPFGAGDAATAAPAAAVEGHLNAAVEWPRDPAANLPTLGQLATDGAPPPLCPPNCVPSIPSAPNCTFVLAARTATGIDEYNRTGHYLCAPPLAKDNGHLVVFFTGTQPSDQTLAMQSVASFGYHALALSYNNFGAPNGQCDVSYPKNQSIGDPMCEYNVEQARLWGGNLSAALWARRQTPNNPKGNPYSLVNATNSIMNRLDKALRFAAQHNIAGSDKWANFLAAAKPTSSKSTSGNSSSCGATIAWSKLVLSGWSRGSAYPIHISKFFAVTRIVLFCGLEDYVGLRGPDSIPEPWIAGMPSKVPTNAIWGIGGTHGGCCSNWMRNWGSSAGGLGLLGQGYADFENGSVVGKSAAEVEIALKGS